MADQNVTIKVEAKSIGNLGAPFDKLKTGAKDAKGAIEGLGQSAGRFKENLEGVKSGLLGLAVSTNALPASVGKAAESLNALSSAASVLKGVGGLLGGAGLGGGAAIAAGVAVVGIAFHKLTAEIERGSQAAEEGKDKLKRLAEVAAEFRAGRFSGLGTDLQQSKAAAEFGIRGRFSERTQQLGESRAGALDRAKALQAFPDRGFDPLREGLERISQIQVADKPVDTLERKVAAMGQLAGQRGGAPAPALQREEMVANQAAERAQADLDHTKRMQAEFLERQKDQERLGLLQERMAVRQKEFNELNKTANEGKGLDWEHFQASLFGANDESRGILAKRAGAGRRMEQLQGEAAIEQPEMERILAKLGPNAKQATPAEADMRQQQVLAAQQRLLEAQQRQLEIKQKIREASLDELKTLREAAQQQAQMAKQVVLEQEARLKGSKVGLGLSTKEEIARAARLSDKMAAGGQLTRRDIEFAQGKDIFKEGLEKEGLRRADADPRIKRILEQQGIVAGVERAKAAEKQILKLDAELVKEINVKVQANAQVEAKDLANQLAPAFQKVIEDVNKQMAIALQQMVRQFMEAERRKEKEANKPNAPG